MPQTTPHMHDRFERFFAPRFLLALNLVIIVGAETIGGGRTFYDTGFIHVPVAIFLFLACIRIFGRYRLYDKASRRFLGWCLTALALLFLAHGIEFADQNILEQWPPATVYGAIICIHLAAFLAVTVGTFPILRAFGKVRSAIVWTSVSAFVALVALLESYAAFVGVIPGVSPLLYAAIAAVAGLSTAVPTLAVAKLVPNLKGFSEYLTSALAFSAIAAGVDAFHLLVGEPYVVYQQATYVSHFAFYAALSLMFLAFGKLANTGGVYDVGALAERRPARPPGWRRQP